MHKRATSNTIEHKALMSPLQLIAEHAQRNADRSVTDFHQDQNRAADFFHRSEDRALDHFHRMKDREVARQQAVNRTLSGA
jgi:hypothetical protein